jgi:hypothetical protein
LRQKLQFLTNFKAFVFGSVKLKLARCYLDDIRDAPPCNFKIMKYIFNPQSFCNFFLSTKQTQIDGDGGLSKEYGQKYGEKKNTFYVEMK